jgi:hypothetical protein
MVIIEILLFIFLLITVFYIPGRYVLRLFRFEHSDFMTTLLLSFTIGICQYMSAMYFLSWIGVERVFYILPFIAAFFEFQKSKQELFLALKSWKPDRIILLILLAGTIVMSYIMYRSGMADADNNLLFYGVNAVDAIWHITLIENLARNFPPTHPGLSEIPLRGYNFFYDLLLANIHKLYPFSVLDLFFRYFSVTLALLFGIATIVLARFLKMGQVATVTFLFLSYFVQGLGTSTLPFLGVTYHSPIVQSAANMVDPNVILSIVFLYAAIILLFSKKPSYLVVIILAVLPMIKIYTALLAFLGVGVIALVAILHVRDFRHVRILVISGLLAAVLYLPVNLGAGALLFTPFLLYKHFMESGTAIPEYQWILKYQVYEEHRNYLRIVQLYLIALFVFFIPSLGIRLVSIFSIRGLLKKKFYSMQNIFLLTVIAAGFIIPSLFIQSIAVFVVVQFMWIIYILLLIPTSFTIGKLLGKVTLPKVIITSVFLLVVCMPGTVSLLKIYSAEPMIISRDLVSTLTFIRSNIPQDKSIFVLNEAWKKKYNSGINAVPIVSALSAHSVYYEPEVLEFLHLDEEVSDRKQEVEKLAAILTTCTDKSEASRKIRAAMLKANTDYLLILKPDSCLNTISGVRKIRTSGVISLYEVKEE